MCCWKLFHAKGKNGSSYPRELLPTPQYVVKIDIDDLLGKVSDFLICRRIEGSLEENTVQFNGKTRLKVEALGKIPNLSTNLLGAKFKANKHIAFSPTGDARCDWDGKNIDLAKFKDSFQIIKNYTYVVYRGNFLHNVSIPYRKELNKDDKNKLAIIGINLDNFVAKEVELKGTIKLEHKPTMLNYWHIVMDLYSFGACAPIKRDDATWQKTMVDFVVQKILTVKFETGSESIPSIPKSIYKKPTH